MVLVEALLAVVVGGEGVRVVAASGRSVMAQCAGRHVIAALSAWTVVEAWRVALRGEVLCLQVRLAVEATGMRQLLALLLKVRAREEAVGLGEVLREAYVIERADVAVARGAKSAEVVRRQVNVAAWKGRVVGRVR